MPQTQFDSVALEAAFEEFNLQSGLLEECYHSLQARIEELTRRLEIAQTERHRELLEKERLSNRLSRLLETLPGAFLVIDGDGVILERNSRATDLLNHPLLACCWADVVQREFRPCERVDGDLQLKDGRWVNIFRRPLETEGGEILLLTDVTDSRRMSKLLERHERLSALGEMTASLAHQIRTPLSSAILYLSDHVSDCGAAEDETVSAVKALECLRTLDGLVTDTLVFASGSKHDADNICIADLLQSVVDVIDPQLDENSFVTIEFDDPALNIQGNWDALHGALLNLVTNALEASSKPQIELSAATTADQIWLIVADNGNGVADEIRHKLFEPFYTTRKRGTGLGLSIVRTVARAHGGDVVVESGSLGSTFAICLPIDQRPNPLPGGHQVVRELETARRAS